MNRLLTGWRALPLTSRIGIGIVAVLCAVAVLAPWLAPYDPAERVTTPFARPSAAHPLGADDAGHDLLSLLIHGTRPSLLVGMIAALVATVVGMAVGLTAGYLRGAVDTVLMRAVDVVLSLPVVPLTLVVGVLAGPGLRTQIAVISLALWAPMARELRAQVLSVRERDHIHALRAMGARHGYVLIRHVVPAVAVLVVPQLVLAVKSAVLLEATLAFLGLGDITSMSWGMMLSVANSRNAFLTDAWLWWVVPPGVLIGLTVLGVALAAGAVERDAAAGLRTRRTRRARRGGAEPTRTARQAVPAASAPAAPDASAPAVPDASAHEPLLRLEGLTVRYGEHEGSGGCEGVDLSLERGQVLGLVGGSGSGKSTVAAAVVGLMAPAAGIRAGRILLDGTDLVPLGERERRSLLGARIGLVPQEAQSALNPVHRIGEQIVEALQAHAPVPRDRARARARELLEMVGLPGQRYDAYPHQISGGQRQRVTIAIALANSPELLVADEPTSGLDVIVQQEILDLLLGLRDRLGLTMLLVTHDLPVIAQAADRLAVMDGGRVVECGDAAELLTSPQHPCTRRLLEALPVLSEAVQTPAPSLEEPVTDEGGTGGAPVLSVSGLTVAYGGTEIVREMSLVLRAGESVALVGGSGAGKSSVAKAIAGLATAPHGRIELETPAVDGADPASIELLSASAAGRREARRAVHLVMQDPYASLPPHRRVLDIVAEPLVIHRAAGPALREEEARRALVAVGLDPARYARRFPHELSGGERQRVAFSRAIVTRPAVILADEPTGMLDASLRAEVAQLMSDLAHEHGTAILHITHDLALAAGTCDRVVVMDGGEVVEHGPMAAVLRAPQHPATRRLLEAAQRGASRTREHGDRPSPAAAFL